MEPEPPGAGADPSRSEPESAPGPWPSGAGAGATQKSGGSATLVDGNNLCLIQFTVTHLGINVRELHVQTLANYWPSLAGQAAQLMGGAQQPLIQTIQRRYPLTPTRYETLWWYKSVRYAAVCTTV